MIAIFFDEDGEQRMTGYATDGYRTTDEVEEMVETTEEELNSLIPDGYEGNWQTNSDHYLLADGEITFDDSE